MTVFSQQLKKYRVLKNLSQEDLAQKLFISRQSISKYENGEATPDLDSLVKLSQILQVSLNELVLGKQADIKIERVVEQKNVNISNIIKISWIIFANMLLALIVLLLIYTLLNMFALTSLF